MKFYIKEKNSKNYKEISDQELKERLSKGENIIFENYIFNDKYYKVK